VKLQIRAESTPFLNSLIDEMPYHFLGRDRQAMRVSTRIVLSQETERTAAIANEDRCNAWRDFFAAHSSQLFQMALLLAADADVAESSLMLGISHVDLSRSPSERDLLAIQELIAGHSCLLASSVMPGGASKAESLLQVGLRPVLRLRSYTRLCFVLCFLIGYSASSCARMLGISESAVRRFLEKAVLELDRIGIAAESPFE
jgi:hypothetical protein